MWTRGLRGPSRQDAHLPGLSHVGLFPVNWEDQGPGDHCSALCPGGGAQWVDNNGTDARTAALPTALAAAHGAAELRESTGGRPGAGCVDEALGAEMSTESTWPRDVPVTSQEREDAGSTRSRPPRQSRRGPAQLSDSAASPAPKPEAPPGKTAGRSLPSTDANA